MQSPVEKWKQNLCFLSLEENIEFYFKISYALYGLEKERKKYLSNILIRYFYAYTILVIISQYHSSVG